MQSIIERTTSEPNKRPTNLQTDIKAQNSVLCVSTCKLNESTQSEELSSTICVGSREAPREQLPLITVWLQPGAEAVKEVFNASKRIPSWNVIARENSTGSLDDLVAESNLHASSGRNLSDSETESVELSSWTRTGGPLMRTASANKFIDFVRSLDVDIALTRGFSSSPSSPAANTSSITVTEGDFLQPARTSNGIVLNVVRRENLEMSIGNQRRRWIIALNQNMK
ncbi:unnamed protein product [Brassica rapa]|uniref:Uncharacterized protein n=1 Tax=Brassica campestris TaxID=3711 RepID=A0A8D9DS75_BRACM|nr:unnamed protein product [Brassica rapa]